MTDIKQLERELAYSAARSDIESICIATAPNGMGATIWRDTRSLGWEDAEFVSSAITYLESRNLLRRHPEMVELVRVVDA